MSYLHQKQFRNPVCQECILRNTDKYGRFEIKCGGITVEEDVAFAIKNGLSEDDARWTFDPRHFFRKVYGHEPRWYQEPILLCTSKNLCSRQCRQSGKTLAIMMKIIQFVTTNDDKTVLVVGPNEKVVKKIYDEYIWRDCLGKNVDLKDSVVSKSQKPFYEVKFDNGSKIMLMIANESARGQTCDWLYIDEAALIPTEMLNSIILTSASKGDEAVLIQTSTPRGRGNVFYQACKENPEFNEYHVPISVIKEMQGQINRFKRLLGEAGFMQECEAEFPDTAGGPFNYKGIDLAKQEYEYDSCNREDGVIYIGGVDWNGPAIGTYFYIISFDPNTYSVKVVDKAVVSSSSWNSTVAKNTLINLNRKWKPKHWMADYGYGQTIVEELRAYSMKLGSTVPHTHPDAQIKYILETVEFGSFLDLQDPFTKEEIKKTTKSFIVGQVSRLFEPSNGWVPITFSKFDEELVKSLENYKLLNITAKGVEQYGFEKGDGIEDHCLDALMLAIYGIVKYYNELFKRVIYQSVILAAQNLTKNAATDQQSQLANQRAALLISDNDPNPIERDGGNKFHKDPEETKQTFISRTFARINHGNRDTLDFSAYRSKRSGIVKRSLEI